LKSPNLEKIVYTSTVNVLGAPHPFGSLGDENTSPFQSKNRSIHSFTSKEQILSFIDEVHFAPKSKSWVKKIGVGYFDSKLAAQELVQRFHDEYNYPVVSTLPGTFFGPMDHFIGNGIYILRVFQGRIPVFVKSGFPLTHVRDVAKGQILAMEKGKPGEKYIISGKTEDNKYMGEMLDCIADVISKCEPEREIKHGWKQVPYWLAMFGATISEAHARLTKSPCLLSKATVKASKIISFYSHKKAEQQLNYRPEYSFEDAVRDHYLYYKEYDMLLIKNRKD
jgi:nucleoside-diphosphate-sugar epimerase